MKTEEKQSGNHEKYAIGEDPPCRLYGVISVRVDFFRQNGVKSPHYGCCDGEKVAFRIQMESGTAEADQYDSRHSDEKSEKEALVQMFFRGKEDSREERRKKRCRRDNDTHIGSLRKRQGDIFQKIIERYAAEPGRSKSEFPPKSRIFQAVGKGGNQSGKSQKEAAEQNFHRRKVDEEYFCGYKRSAPDCDRDQGSKVAETVFLSVIHGFFLSFS